MNDIQSNKNDNQINSCVIANLRHDLRTPINAILGYSEMLLEDFSEIDNLQDKNVIKELKSIQLRGKEILSIINQLLNQNNFHNSQENLEKNLTILKQVTSPLITVIIDNCQILKVNMGDNDFMEDIERIYQSSISLKSFVLNLEKLNFLTIPENLDNYTDVPIDDFIKTRYPKSLDNNKEITGHILAVDDNENNRDLLSSQLTKEGYTVSNAINGRQALEMIAQKDYDLILLDLLMPEIDGYQVLETLKKDEKKKHIPVIMISALDEMENIIRCIEIGAEDYLPKPFNKTLLRARIGASLEKKILRDREVEYLKKLNLELDKGREMQLNFLPDKPLKINNWEIASFFKPARQVAGDFYDTFTLPSHNLVLVLADVCDKGVGAALFMGLFRSLIRIFSQQQTLNGNNTEILSTYKPLETGWISSDIDTNIIHFNALQSVSLTNNYVADNHGDLGMFATMFVGILNPETGLLTYINGGHESLIVTDSQGNTKHKLNSTGPAVGMMPDITFNFKQIFLEPEDILFGNTDGVTDARSISREFFHQKRLNAILQQPFNSAQILVNTIKDQVLEHIGTADQFDDITMLAIRREKVD
ncbi:SpoIIE family protein phosphatase [Geminocystis sp. GBBB08]|uniref:SpoIIE family protein phosphatase n=1 Tax=Geminocystis sp. GBBB08 TaxID=2604140 RepID=UPI0027E37BDC|nr:SpoIIE family protein phosphatase [Geminocystis sp. GBBB08]MBL1210521.1 SpoIIE family protein phosphatase [Geminocystis sp. GBBB08]